MSIKQYMIESIGSQHVRKRRPPPAQPANARKPLDTIKQKPAHKKRKHLQKNIRVFKGISRLDWAKFCSKASSLVISCKLSFKLFLKGKLFVRQEKHSADSSLPKLSMFFRPPSIPASTFLRLMFPALIIAAIGVVVLVLYCSFAQSWNNGGSFITPWEDARLQANLASYVGLSPSASEEKGVSQPSEDIPLELMETFSWLNYTIKRGDSVSKIAVKYGISMDAIIASNGITNVKRLSEGQMIKVPNMDGIPYTVKKGDTLLKISTAMKVPLAAILDANDVQSDTITPGTVLFIPGARMRTEDLKLALGEFFIYPIRGRLTSPFGWRNDPISGVKRYHAALDMAAAIGTPVKAAMDGQVTTVGFNGTYGKFIILSHSNGFQSMYAHLSVTSVTQGTKVGQGAKIGEVGNTGYSTGPHLHFAVFKNGRAIDPRDLLSP
jgi:murein DD-endopeptidase MepM/ murein hydrolase activator NlpD